jgi:hypothetical protein
MTVVDAVATALQQDSEAARVFMIRLAEQGYGIIKREDPSMPRDPLSMLEPPTPNVSEIRDDVAEGPIR